MATIEAKTHQNLIELRGYAKAWQRAKAEQLFRRIVNASNRETLILISHDLTEILGDFEKKRRRELGQLLEQALEGKLGPEEKAADTPGDGAAPDLRTRYTARLSELRDKRIFQWATYYRDNIGYIYKDVIRLMPALDADAEETIQSLFATHSREIFSQGYAHVLARGLSAEIGLAKSLRGLQQFMYVVVGLLRDQREASLSKHQATICWDIASAMISGILLGYRSVELGDISGSIVLSENLTTWLPMLGFCRGRHAVQLAQPGQSVLNDGAASVCSLLLGVERWSIQSSTIAVLPRHSRVNLGLNRLDITYGVGVDRVSQDITAAAFFNGQTHMRDLRDAMSLRMVIVAELNDTCREWVETNCVDEIINASDTNGDIHQFDNLAGTIAATLTKLSAPASTQPMSGRLPRNYAKEFPLDDPLFRRGQFEVERHSVNQVIQDLQRGTGAYVWCSVRRSGKTTAAEALAGASDQTLVVMQTMDHRPSSLEFNILSSRVREALESGRAIPETFFNEVLLDCVVATTQLEVAPRKLVFIIDEYESLFGLIDDYTARSAGLKHTVALPLISQMLAFSMKNVLLFMGQRPDAHMILLSQNQLSPNVRQHLFPLFEHQPGTPSEFETLVHRILGDKLRFTTRFIDAVYRETKGHPYLTVNLLVDFCDWLMQSASFELGHELDEPLFLDFSKERLDLPTLKRSPYYDLFHKMLAEFCSERSREQEPWLYSVTTILREIVRRHPKRLKCSLATYEEIARPLEALVNLPPGRLLNSAAMANFLYDADGSVHLSIPLMGRLAASATSRVGT